jgi:hypothetical protein
MMLPFPLFFVKKFFNKMKGEGEYNLEFPLDKLSLLLIIV